MQKIALAIGHNYAPNAAGVPDKGAVGNGKNEADIAKLIVDGIINRGIPGFELVKVPEKISISQRNRWVNDRQKDLAAYIEFHLDSAAATATGCTTYFVAWNSWAEGEAKQFQKAYTRITGLKGRGVKGDTTSAHKRLGAIRDNKIFSLLVELGFISNASDLKTILDKGVEGAAVGIQEMFAS